VRTNGLQEGDFIVIYSDVKCGKYVSEHLNCFNINNYPVFLFILQRFNELARLMI